MKKPLILLLVLAGTTALLVGVWLMAYFGRRTPSLGSPVPNAANPKKSSPPALSVGSATNNLDAERLRYLEQLGHLPYPITTRDIMLGAKTTWWGKPLDPAKFWAGKVVWCDKIAKGEAAAHGRAWPPIPYEDPSLPAYPDDEGLHGVGMGSETMGAPSATSSKEDAFWIKFITTHPKPPESLQYQQLELAQTAFAMLRHSAGSQATTSAVGSQEVVPGEFVTRDKQYLIDAHGFPPEALADDALFWEYVMSKREEYQRNQQLWAQASTNPVLQRRLSESLIVDPKYVTQPLTESQIRVANAWKIAYLRRLRRERTDESYIQAYLQAWTLSSNDVFGQ